MLKPKTTTIILLLFSSIALAASEPFIFVSEEPDLGLKQSYRVIDSQEGKNKNVLIAWDYEGKTGVPALDKQNVKSIVTRMEINCSTKKVRKEEISVYTRIDRSDAPIKKNFHESFLTLPEGHPSWKVVDLVCAAHKNKRTTANFLDFGEMEGATPTQAGYESLLFKRMPIEFGKTTKKDFLSAGFAWTKVPKVHGMYASEERLQINPTGKTLITFSPNNKLLALITMNKSEESCEKIKSQLTSAFGPTQNSSSPNEAQFETWKIKNFSITFDAFKKQGSDSYCSATFFSTVEDAEPWASINLIDGITVGETPKEEVQKLVDLISTEKSKHNFIYRPLLPGSQLSAFDFNPESGVLEQISDYIPEEAKKAQDSLTYCEEIRKGLTSKYGLPYIQPVKGNPITKAISHWFTDEGVISQRSTKDSKKGFCIIQRNGLNYKKFLLSIKGGVEAKDHLTKSIPNLVPVRDDVRSAQLYFNSKNVDLDKYEKTATVWTYEYYPDELNATVRGEPFNLKESYVRYSCKKPVKVTFLSNYYTGAKREKRVDSYRNDTRAKIAGLSVFDEEILPGSSDDELRENVCNRFFNKKKRK